MQRERVRVAVFVAVFVAVAVAVAACSVRLLSGIRWRLTMCPRSALRDGHGDPNPGPDNTPPTKHPIVRALSRGDI